MRARSLRPALLHWRAPHAAVDFNSTPNSSTSRGDEDSEFWRALR